MKLIIATTNFHKFREYKAMLKNLSGIDLYSLRDFPNYIPPEETGLSFEENAIIKASHAANALNELVLADDSGLVVPSIGGEPGIYSARYAGGDATDAENRKKLLDKMQLLQENQRAAYFECVIVLAASHKIIKTTHGFLEGTIAHEERGRNGFGYDPIFMKYDYNKTIAELEEDVKNRISHRRKALDKLIATLESLVHKTQLNSC
ncbi:MAG: XTP/dITP diphosphatase [Chlamydiales bacterium]|nr:XTP/dITP diphosphatase [Chlamydiales bacterium]